MVRLAGERLVRLEEPPSRPQQEPRTTEETAAYPALRGFPEAVAVQAARMEPGRMVGHVPLILPVVALAAVGVVALREGRPQPLRAALADSGRMEAVRSLEPAVPELLVPVMVVMGPLPRPHLEVAAVALAHQPPPELAVTALLELNGMPRTARAAVAEALRDRQMPGLRETAAITVAAEAGEAVAHPQASARAHRESSLSPIRRAAARLRIFSVPSESGDNTGFS